MWFTLNCAAALLVFVIFHSLQRRRLQQQQQTLAAQVHCRSTLDSVSALMAYLGRREPFLLYKTNSDELTFDKKAGELLGVSLWVDR